MIRIDHGVVQVFGPKQLIEVESIMLMDTLIMNGLINEDDIRKMRDLFTKYLDGTLTETDHFHGAPGLTPEQSDRLMKDLGIQGMTREEIIKRNLRKAMEDEWKV